MRTGVLEWTYGPIVDYIQDAIRPADEKESCFEAETVSSRFFAPEKKSKGFGRMGVAVSGSAGRRHEGATQHQDRKSVV